MSSGIRGQPERRDLGTSGSKPRHVTRGGQERWEYGKGGPARIADLGEISRAATHASGSQVRLGIVGKLSAPWVYVNRRGVRIVIPAGKVVFLPAEVYKRDLLRELRVRKPAPTPEQPGATRPVTVAEALAATTHYEWDEVYTVYMTEGVQPGP